MAEARALGTTAGAWALLIAGSPGGLAGRGGDASAAAIAAAAAWVWILRFRHPRARWPRAPSPGRAAGALALGVAAGFASLPFWCATLVPVGLALGLPASSRASGGPIDLAAVGVLGLAPLLEEPLYRERLLLAFEGRAGRVGATLLSSVWFAIPHVHAWSVFGTFVVGLALGAAAWRARSLEVCVGLHLGMNLAIAAGASTLGPGVASPVASAAAATSLFAASRRVVGGSPP